ncbi:MAG: hypothetical protein RXN91_08250 [Caldivirga sp.]
MGVVRLVWFVVVGVVALAVAAALILILHTAHQAPVQYVGSPSGFEGFVPSGQTVSYKGSQDPVGDLILSNGTTLSNVIWNGQYASTIIQNHNQIIQLNNQFVGQTDQLNEQTYVPLQDVYVIKGQVPIMQVTINGQPYTVIEASSINPANIAGFYTYDKWIPNFVAAMNTQGTYAAVLPGNSPVFQWTNTTGTVAYQTWIYQDYIRGFAGRVVLVQSNGTIIPYGAGTPSGSALFNFSSPQQTYNPSS